MTQLTTLRQRIKSIETIKKITHAMRLIAMSIHSRLNQQNKHLKKYGQEFQRIWHILQKKNSSSILTENNNIPNHKILIIVGSQKGLCGSFNNTLFKYFEEKFLQQNIIDSQTKIISIGKIATEYLIKHSIQPDSSFNVFNSANFTEIANKVTEIIIEYKTDNASILSNTPISFFVQKPEQHKLLPVAENNKNIQPPQSLNIDYNFEQDIALISNSVNRMLLTVKIQAILYNSLLAEQAARFISMDTSTRNAESALEEMKIAYNKVRQAIITKELAELASNI